MTFFEHSSPFVLHGVEEQAVVLLEHGQHRLAAHRGPAAEDGGHLVLQQELLGLLREEVPVRGGVLDDRLDLAAEHAPAGVDLLDGHQDDFLQRRLADGHGSAERVQDADLDRLLRAAGCEACRGRSATVAPAASDPFRKSRREHTDIERLLSVIGSRGAEDFGFVAAPSVSATRSAVHAHAGAVREGRRCPLRADWEARDIPREIEASRGIT